MKAFHGSPILFDRFAADKIGSQWKYGGSQGRGIYLTDSRDVACRYAVPRDRMGPLHRASDGKGHVYEVSAPDGEYIDNNRLCSEQKEPARTILQTAMDRQQGYPRFRLDNAASQDIYTQIGALLGYCRKKGGVPLEPALLAAGYVGCKNRVKEWKGALEFVVFDPCCLQILSVAPHQDYERVAA